MVSFKRARHSLLLYDSSNDLLCTTPSKHVGESGGHNSDTPRALVEPRVFSSESVALNFMNFQKLLTETKSFSVPLHFNSLVWCNQTYIVWYLMQSMIFSALLSEESTLKLTCCLLRFCILTHALCCCVVFSCLPPLRCTPFSPPPPLWLLSLEWSGGKGGAVLTPQCGERCFF